MVGTLALLYLTEGVIRRKALHTNYQKTDSLVVPGCCMLFLDEAHSCSTDLNVILARIIPRMAHVTSFKLVLMSASLASWDLLSCGEDFLLCAFWLCEVLPRLEEGPTLKDTLPQNLSAETGPKKMAYSVLP